jgi:hypothetical protein
MASVSLLQTLKPQLPLLILGLAWIAYLIWGTRWLRGAKRTRLF